MELTSEDKILIEILAKTDALWRPFRAPDWASPAPTNIYEARQHFADFGVRWNAGGNENSRQRAHRNLEALAAGGAVIIRRKDKAVYVRLSDAAEIAVRSVCALPNVDEARALVRDVAAQERRPHDATDETMLCPEFWLTDLADDDDENRERLADLQELALPALARGWLLSRSDIHGRVYYTSTPNGRKAPATELPSGLPAPTEEACGFYYDVFGNERQQRLRSATPDHNGEIGFIPLSCSIDLRKPRQKKKAPKSRGTK